VKQRVALWMQMEVLFLCFLAAIPSRAHYTGPSGRFWNFSATGHLLLLGSGDLDASRFAHSGRTEGQRREVCSPGSEGTGCW